MKIVLLFMIFCFVILLVKSVELAINFFFTLPKCILKLVNDGDTIYTYRYIDFIYQVHRIRNEVFI